MTAAVHTDRLAIFLVGMMVFFVLMSIYRDAVWNPRVRQMNAGIREKAKGWWLPWRR